MGRLLLLCVTALLACGVCATEQVFQNVSVSLLEQGAYLDIPFPFAVTVQLQADRFDPSPADCDPDCRTIYISGFPLEVPKPFPDSELLTHMRATLRGIPCTYNALLGKIACHYYAGVFPTDEPLTLTGTITIKDFHGAHELTDTPIAFVFGATTRAVLEAVTETPPVPFTIRGYKPVMAVFETVDLPAKFTSETISTTLISLSAVGISISALILVATAVSVLFAYDIKGRDA